MPAFTLTVPLKESGSPQMTPALVALLEHAASKGQPLEIRGTLTLEAIGGVQMVQIILHDADSPPGFIVESLSQPKKRGPTS